jgi:outer membrane protein assembly factor BamB
MWPWRGTVVVLVSQPSGHTRLLALDSASGAVRWTLPLPHGTLGGQAVTAGGVLAIAAPDGLLSGADLTTGRLLWSRRNGPSTGPLAFGAVVVAGSNRRAIGYDSRTGRVLWTAHGLPADTVLTAADGLALVQAGDIGAGQPTAVTALVPGTGRVAWRFDPGSYPSFLGAGPAGIVMSTDRVYLVSQVTGQAIWSAAAYVPLPGQGQVPAIPAFIVTADAVAGVEGQGVPNLVDRRAADGTVLWSVPLPGYDDTIAWLAPAAGPEAVLAMGPGNGVISRLWAFRLGSGALAGSTALPTLDQAPLTAVGGDVLLQLDDPECGMPAARSAAGPSMS